MYVVDDEDLTVYAYQLAGKSRDATRDFDLSPFNADPQGAWSDGEKFYVADSRDDMIYVYDLPEGNTPAEGAVTIADGLFGRRAGGGRGADLERGRRRR